MIYIPQIAAQSVLNKLREEVDEWKKEFLGGCEEENLVDTGIATEKDSKADDRVVPFKQEHPLLNNR